MAVSSVPPPPAPPAGPSAAGQQSLLLLAQRKNGIGHGHVISNIPAPKPSAPPASASPFGKVGTKVDKRGAMISLRRAKLSLTISIHDCLGSGGR